jgi:hypothetical protein
MRKIILLVLTVFTVPNIWSQSPEKMSYQAVIRDSDNTLITDAVVGTQISILQGSANGVVVYEEEHSIMTNGNGLLSLEIGTGTPLNGSFTTIDWSNGPYYIRTATDPMGGNNYAIVSTSQMLSVPYALYAATAGNNTPGPEGPQGIQGPPGNDGADGQDGVGIASTVDNNDGTFTINYTDGSSFTTTDLTGPRGEQGIQGPPGNDGVDGLNGTDGADGQDGVGIASTVDNNDGTFTINYTDGSSFTTADLTGPQGAQGIQGEQGPIGPTGLTGPQGVQGPPGNDGADGLNGTDGVDGQDGVGITSTVDNSDGTFTINYTDGSSFTTADLTGPQGAQGIQGEQGPIGPTGATGPQGIQGPPGNDGVDGLNGQDGVGITSTVDNNDGTFTLNYSDGSSFTTADLTGPQGAQGEQGSIGPTGLTGPQGIQGPAGATGPQGPTGATGPAGATGANGLNGADGQDGLSAYEIWLNLGNMGSEADFIASLTGPTGVDGANGQDGNDGKNTLINTTTEPAGANCANGGLKIEVGLDENENGVLEISEINNSMTKYVCNLSGNSQSLFSIDTGGTYQVPIGKSWTVTGIIVSNVNPPSLTYTANFIRYQSSGCVWSGYGYWTVANFNNGLVLGKQIGEQFVSGQSGCGAGATRNFTINFNQNDITIPFPFTLNSGATFDITNGLIVNIIEN